jgi:hypothetical protein
MPTTQTQPSPEATTEPTRPLYVRRVPESVWELVHINAIKSRMPLQDYLVRIMEGAEPIESESDSSGRELDADH